MTTSKFYDWQARYAKVNEHNGWVPWDFWLEAWEKQATLDFHLRHPLEGYRRLTLMIPVPDIRPGVPLSVEDAQRLVSRYVDYYNTVRLHSAIGYVTPQAKLEGREPEILAARDRKLEEARRRRQLRRQETYQKAQTTSGATTALPLN